MRAVPCLPELESTERQSDDIVVVRYLSRSFHLCPGTLVGVRHGSVGQSYRCHFRNIFLFLFFMITNSSGFTAFEPLIRSFLLLNLCSPPVFSFPFSLSLISHLFLCPSCIAPRFARPPRASPGQLANRSLPGVRGACSRQLPQAASRPGRVHLRDGALQLALFTGTTPAQYSPTRLPVRTLSAVFYGMAHNTYCLLSSN